MATDKHILVSGRAFERPSFKGFRRGGIFWPSEGEHFALVTPALLQVLEQERMIAIRIDPPLPDGIDLDTIKEHDVPPRLYLDEAAIALDEVKRLDAEIAREKALLEAAAKRAELEKLRAQRKAKEAKAAKATEGDEAK